MKIGGCFRLICSSIAHMQERSGHRRFGRLDVGHVFAFFVVGRSAPEALTHADLWLYMITGMSGILYSSSSLVLPT